jgi:hypothetical protein
MSEDEARQIAERVLDFLANQKYQGEEILHAVICCDWVSRQRMISSLTRVIQNSNRIDVP